uniref:THAP-type domain-containing protein n=2 Tax=Clastoptera arizonana TaxID=38151 RepID=A0A1B6D027_9HEMI
MPSSGDIDKKTYNSSEKIDDPLQEPLCTCAESGTSTTKCASCFKEMYKNLLKEHQERKSIRRHKCCFIGCTKTKAKYPDTHFFSFPVSRPDLCKEWVKNCANGLLTCIPEKALNYRVVCEEHFTDDSFFSTMRTKLKKTAIPTLVSQTNE